MSGVLEELFTSQARAEVFRLLFSKEAKPMYLREIQRRTGLAVRAVQIELDRLKKLDLVEATKDGNRVYFLVKKSNPIYPELQSLVTKTMGIEALLKNALEPEEDIDFCFIYGSYTRGEETSTSDIDLMVLGEMSLKKLTSLVGPIESEIGREISINNYSTQEFMKKLKAKNSFLTTVFKDKKVFIKGLEDEFKKMARKR